jgi:putative DNA primase/helicase
MLAADTARLDAALSGDAAGDLCTSVLEGLSLLHPRRSGELFEVRVLVPGGVDSGYFADPESAAAAIEAHIGKHGANANYYVTLNPIDPACAAGRAVGLIQRGARETTRDAEIVRRRWLLIDVDPVRKGSTAATADELRLALERRDAVAAYLSDVHGWPDPARAMSGNGGHAGYPIDLSAGSDTDALLKRVLEALSAQFSDDTITVDTTVHNRSRICKVYGTIARKGIATPDRPHRRAEIEFVPDRLDVVAVEQLRAVAALAPVNGRRATADTTAKAQRPAPVDRGRRIAQCRLYVRKVDPAIDGQHGDDQTVVAAMRCWDFGLDESDALTVLRDEYNPRCAPPWTDRELERKVRSAYKSAKGPFGGKLNEDRPGWRGAASAVSAPVPVASSSDTAPAESLVLDPSDPLPSARTFVARAHTVRGVMALWNQSGVFYDYNAAAGAYHELDEGAVRAGLYNLLEGASRWTDNGGGQAATLAPFKPSKHKIENVVDALRAVCNLPATRQAPCWLEADPGFDPFDVLPCRNGLLYIPTRALLAATPAFFTLNGLDFAYDSLAPSPECWLRFLEDLWPADVESRETLQEWIGYLLTPRTHFQKIGMIVGPKRSGKGTIARVIRRLLGDRNVCGPTLSNMSEQFGLSILIGKTAAIIADARISGRTDTAVVAERLLSISGEDSLSVPRKYLPDWNGRLSTRFLVLTNELPRIEDASGALSSRFVVLALMRSFYGQEDHNLFDRFVPELPGILNWALAGWDRLYARGRFVQPQSAAELIQEFEDLGSPIGAFVRDRCEVGHGFEVPQSRLFETWRAWCQETGRERAGTVQTFGRNLRAAVPWLCETRPSVLGARVRYYSGLRLKAGGE